MDHLERQALAGKRRLWSRANPTPPWEWRHGGGTSLPPGPTRGAAYEDMLRRALKDLRAETRAASRTAEEQGEAA